MGIGAWDEMTAKVKEFKQTYGHCDVPVTIEEGEGEYVTLAKGVSQIRKEMKKYVSKPKGAGSLLDDSQIKILTDLGLSHGSKRKEQQVQLIESWDEMIAELKEYSQKYGHCDVPRVSLGEEYAALSKWVCQVRKERSTQPENTESFLDDERLGVLRELGFS